jgi:AcrR family transcriptional regulator
MLTTSILASKLTLSTSAAILQSKEEKMSNRTQRQGYHHGNARHALISAAEELLENVGAAGLSLRQLSERAGLSRQAAYNHFADKQALLAELAVAGFERLTAAMGRATAGRSGEEGLERAGDAYIAFAQASPAQFRLMFSQELVDLSRFPTAVAAGEAAFGALTRIIASFVPEEWVSDLSLTAWCLVHGYATLCIEANLEPRARRKERARLFAQVIRTFCSGKGRQTLPGAPKLSPKLLATVQCRRR